MIKNNETDWKYMCSIKDMCLQTLCKRINDESAAIIADKGLTQHQRYKKLYQHIKKEDKVIALIFDGTWSRSRVHNAIINFDTFDIAPADYLEHLSEGAQESVLRWRAFNANGE